MDGLTRPGPFLELPPALLEFVASPQPARRFTSYQLLRLMPTLLVDSVIKPVPPQEVSLILLAGLHDPSVDVRLEAVGALCAVLSEGVTGKEREQIGPQLVAEAFKVRLRPGLGRESR